MPCWATLTCDSDGKVDQFIDRRDVKRTLPLHEYDGSDYYLGAFLVGAYQEILATCTICSATPMRCTYGSALPAKRFWMR